MQRLRILIATLLLLGAACVGGSVPTPEAQGGPSGTSTPPRAQAAPTTAPATAPVQGAQAAPTPSPKAATPAPGPAKAAAVAAPAPAAKAGEGAPAEDEAKPDEPVAVLVGSPFAYETELDQVHPKPGKVKLWPRSERPLALFFWGTSATGAKQDLVELDRFVKATGLLGRMDVYGVGSFNTERQKPEDIREMAVILGIETLPILADPGFILSSTVGATQFPELAIIDKRGILIAKGLRGLDHGRLMGSAATAGDLLKHVAANGTAQLVTRTTQFYPSDRLIGRKVPDFELPLFSAEGFGKAKSVKLSSLLSGKRPAVVMFFSSTCTHCQVDVPQMVKFQLDHPDSYDIVGVTRIKHDRHRAVSAKYFTDQGIQFPIVEDGGIVSDVFNVTSTPTAFFLSPGGTVVKVSYYQHMKLEEDYLKLRPALLGAPPPPPPLRPQDWAFPLRVNDEKGKELDLATLAGKPTVIHLWATWCIPCRKELPEFLARLPELRKHANVLMVSVEDDPKALAKHRQDTGLEYTSYLKPHGGLAESIDFGRSVPRTYVLDASGNVTYVHAGTLEWTDEAQVARVAGRLVGF